MPGTERQIRALSAFGILLSLVLVVSAYTSVFQFQGTVWPGFPVRVNSALSLPIFASPEVQADLLGTSLGMRVSHVNDTPVSSGKEVYALVGSMAAGTPVHYSVVDEFTGESRTLQIPAQVFSQAVAYRVWMPFLGLGLLFMGTLSLAVFARPDLAAPRALFMVGLGVANQYCFALPLLYFAHDYGFWTAFFGFPTVAGILILPLVFPVVRMPGRRFSQVAIAMIGLIAAGFMLAELWLGQSPSPEFFWVELIRRGVLILGFILLLGNVAYTAWGHADPGVRGQARMFLRGIFLAGFVLAGLRGLRAFGGDRFAYLEPLVLGTPLLIFSSSIAIGMSRYGLFGFGQTARRSLGRLSLFLISLSAGYIVFAFVEIFLDTAEAWGIVFGLSLILMALVSIWPRAYRSIEGLLEAVLVPERQRSRLALEAAAVEMARIRDAKQIGVFIERTLGDTLGASWVRCMIGRPGGPLREIVASEAGQTIDPPTELYQFVHSGGHLVTQPTAAPGGALSGAVGEARRRDIALIASMPSRDGIGGAILCGPPRQSAPYTAADLALVKLLATAVAIALENARSWSEVHELRTRLEAENLFLRAEARSETGTSELIGDSPLLREVIAQIDAVAGTAASVLVVGETGAGKELAVRRLHRNSLRAGQSLVKVACAALPESLLESELFGFESGAFTGATQRRVGRFEVADGGTLFLDDVDTLPLSVQAKLLRAIQEGEIQRLGSNEVLQVDVRLVAATNRDLLAEVREGRFREDLYYRLNVVPIELPALRERKGDIPALVAHFADTLGPELGREVVEISSESLADLQRYSWPGNIRELRNVVERALVMGRGPILQFPEGFMVSQQADRTASVLYEKTPPAAQRGSGSIGSAPLKELLQSHKKRLIEEALAESEGNQAAAAKTLGVHRSNLNRMIKDLGVVLR
jgi:formate hydrogenlyase transcriptional activator